MGGRGNTGWCRGRREASGGIGVRELAPETESTHACCGFQNLFPWWMLAESWMPISCSLRMTPFSSPQAQKIKITIAFFFLSADSFLVSKWKEANANIL
jgi:hypothetical protein